MAEPVSVAVELNNLGQPVQELVTISDTQNHSFRMVGVPGNIYNLVGLLSAPVGVSSGAANNSSSSGIPLPIQEPNPLESVTFTDANGDTLTLLGAPNTIYDLTLLPYLLAVVSAQDMFMAMQFGSDYLNVKNEYLSRVNLV